MRKRAEFLVGLCGSLPYLNLLSSKKTVILLYHGVPRQSDGGGINAAVFEKHILFLKKEFRIVPRAEIETRLGARDATRVMLTFDDGFRNHADVVAPILKKYDVPATFFVCSRPAQPGKYLWFTYLQALEDHFHKKGFSFRNTFFDMSSKKRHTSVRQLKDILLELRPHPLAMYEAIENELPHLEDFVTGKRLADGYAGMTDEQIAHLSGDPLFSVGIHTVDHPFLSRCDGAEAHRQISDNKKWIEKVTGRSCQAIAYPSGDYNADVLAGCEQTGLETGYAVIPQLGTRPDFELARIGIYSPSLDILRFKAQWGNLIRVLGLHLG